MSKPPSEAPLGAPPSLPAPRSVSVERLRHVAARILGVNLPPAADEPESGTPSRPPGEGSVTFGRGRRYDAALERTGYTPELSVPPESFEADPNASELEDSHATEKPHKSVSWDEDTTVVARPPPFVPTVRPSVPSSAAERAAIIDPELLRRTADSALLIADPDGSASFDVAFKDDIFADVGCRITVHEGRVVATFRVCDDNTRRLLEAEAGRLRAQLEQRGLRVSDVTVVVEA